MLGALGAVGAIFRAAASFNGKQRGNLDFRGVKRSTMQRLRPEHQFRKWQVKQGLNFCDRPIMADFRRG